MGMPMALDSLLLWAIEPLDQSTPESFHAGSGLPRHLLGIVLGQAK